MDPLAFLEKSQEYHHGNLHLFHSFYEGLTPMYIDDEYPEFKEHITKMHALFEEFIELHSKVCIEKHVVLGAITIQRP